MRNRNYVQKKFSIVLIQKLITFLLIRNINNIIYKFNQYIVIDFYINDYIFSDVENKQSIVAKFFVEIYIVDDFKINLFVNNNVFNAQKINLNLKTQIVILTNCRNFVVSINIIVKKNVDQKRIVKSKTNFKMSFKVTIKIFVTYYKVLLENHDFFFRISMFLIV